MKSLEQLEGGRRELASAKQSKFLASKLNHPERHYISNPSAINHPHKAGTQIHTCFISLSCISPPSPRSLFASSIPVRRVHSISIFHFVTSRLYHSHSLNVVGFACRIYLHKSKLVSSSHSFSFTFIADPLCHPQPQHFLSVFLH